jgi:hypothetical protein
MLPNSVMHLGRICAAILQQLNALRVKLLGEWQQINKQLGASAPKEILNV